jgi:hypothetical protein
VNPASRFARPRLRIGRVDRGGEGFLVAAFALTAVPIAAGTGIYILAATPVPTAIERLVVRALARQAVFTWNPAPAVRPGSRGLLSGQNHNEIRVLHEAVNDRGITCRIRDVK